MSEKKKMRAVIRNIGLLCVMLAIVLLVMYSPAKTYAYPAFGATVEHSGTVGSAGAPWDLYSDGTLLVHAGTINWNSGASPWNAHASDVERIIFTGPIVTGPNLRGLFAMLPNMETINLAVLQT